MAFSDVITSGLCKYIFFFWVILVNLYCAFWVFFLTRINNNFLQVYYCSEAIEGMNAITLGICIIYHMLKLKVITDL